MAFSSHVTYIFFLSLSVYFIVLSVPSVFFKYGIIWGCLSWPSLFDVLCAACIYTGVPVLSLGKFSSIILKNSLCHRHRIFFSHLCLWFEVVFFNHSVQHFLYVPFLSFKFLHVPCLFEIHLLVYLWDMILCLLLDSFYLQGFSLSFPVVCWVFQFCLHLCLSSYQCFYLLFEFYLKSWTVFSISLMLVCSWVSLRHLFFLSSFSLISLSYFFVSLNSLNLWLKFIIVLLNSEAWNLSM